jgi:DNA-binding transcriptional LysR family regulator
MEMRQIRFFMSVAEERHFGRAAERTGIAQPALSQQIRRLERELGAELFDRSTHQVQLTLAGEAFLQVAQRVTRRADEVAAATRRVEMGETSNAGLGVHMPVAARALQSVA